MLHFIVCFHADNDLHTLIAVIYNEATNYTREILNATYNTIIKSCLVTNCITRQFKDNSMY